MFHGRKKRQFGTTQGQVNDENFSFSVELHFQPSQLMKEFFFYQSGSLYEKSYPGSTP